MKRRRNTAKLTGALMLAALAAASTTAAASNTQKYTFFEKNTSFLYTPRHGKPEQSPPPSGPTPGSTIEFTDLNFHGTATRHSQAWSSSDHFLCTFGANAPTCTGQITIDNSILLIQGTGGQGDFSIPIIGGTGPYLHSHGTLHVHDLTNTPNADIEIDLTQ